MDYISTLCESDKRARPFSFPFFCGRRKIQVEASRVGNSSLEYKECKSCVAPVFNSQNFIDRGLPLGGIVFEQVVEARALETITHLRMKTFFEIVPLHKSHPTLAADTREILRVHGDIYRETLSAAKNSVFESGNIVSENRRTVGRPRHVKEPVVDPNYKFGVTHELSRF